MHTYCFERNLNLVSELYKNHVEKLTFPYGGMFFRSISDKQDASFDIENYLKYLTTCLNLRKKLQGFSFLHCDNVSYALHPMRRFEHF